MKRELNLILFTFSFVIFVCHLSYAQTKVLFIGNSYTGANNLPLLVSEIAAGKGEEITYDSYTPGGYHWRLHKDNATTIGKIDSENWDLVVLQQQSQIPSLPEEITGEDHSNPHATAICDTIRSNFDCTDIIFFMTWGRKNGDDYYCDFHPPVCTYDGMQTELRNAYVNFAIENDASVSPVGEAWRYVINDSPEIELYTGDESHPNINGSYLAACVMYATIYRESPLGTTYTASLDADLAEYFQTVAATVVLGEEFDVWRIDTYDEVDAIANFDYYIDDLTVNFENLSEHATSWEWNIDGTIYIEENPSHTFPSSGIYEVILTVYVCNGDVQEMTASIAVTSDLSNEKHSLARVELYPNPTVSNLTIQTSDNQQKEIVLMDKHGKILFKHFMKESSTIDLSNYENGIYLITVSGVHYRVLKQ